MKKYVGDLSLADAALIERYATRSLSVLEFGVGGSTQIIAQSLQSAARFLTIDTNNDWITVTRSRLQKLGVANRCQFITYKNWLKAVTGPFDLIFVDGVFSRRRAFAVRSWPLLAVGGFMLFHDTRRSKDIANVLAVIARNFEEIGAVHLNEPVGGKTSNITTLQKKTREVRINWRRVEDRPEWMYGVGETPEEFWRQ